MIGWHTHVLELGIRLGHIWWYIDKMIMGVVYPCIGIGYWIGSYLTVHWIIDRRGGVLMYWNWVLDWVISYGTSTKWSWGVVYPCIGIGDWIGSYLTVHRQNDHGGGIPMYWNWVLDWVITGGTLNNWSLGWYTHVLELGIGLGHTWRYIDNMIMGVVISILVYYWS